MALGHEPHGHTASTTAPSVHSLMTSNSLLLHGSHPYQTAHPGEGMNSYHQHGASDNQPRQVTRPRHPHSHCTTPSSATTLTASHTAAPPATSRSPTTTTTLAARPSLPSRDVTLDSFEDAYISFILYCNPSVPPDASTDMLRDTFRSLPKSGGKNFLAYDLFRLVQQLETKELKTWAELALKLGVDPPDLEKGESSQKIQQYAVRLKRWMHSMHVDAFFEYLMNLPHPYWTQIPPPSGPGQQGGPRDGVEPSDDMALRALVPQTRPKRARKRNDDDDPRASPSQRPRMASPGDGGHQYLHLQQHDGNAGNAGNAGNNSWSAHPDGRAAPFAHSGSDVSLQPNQPHLPHSAWPKTQDLSQTPLSAYPDVSYSAVTPSTRNSFWGDVAESSPAAGGKSHQRRHGAKVVSSAWRSRGLGGNGTGKARGRPPRNKTSTTEHNPAPNHEYVENLAQASSMYGTDIPADTMTPPASYSSGVVPAASTSTRSPRASDISPATSYGSRRSRPSISLKVPDRPSSSVRLSTPPLNSNPVPGQRDRELSSTGASSYPSELNDPALSGTLNSLPPHHYQHPSPVTQSAIGSDHAHHSSSSVPPPAPAPVTTPPVTSNSNSNTPNIQVFNLSSELAPVTDDVGAGWLDSLEDRTNVADISAYFLDVVLRGHWFDAKGNAIPGCSIEEAEAIITSMIEGLYHSAPSKEAFLVNLGALSGGNMLMTTVQCKIWRMEELEDRNSYACEWEYRFGPVVGQYQITQVVWHDRWKTRWRKLGVEWERDQRKKAEQKAAAAAATEGNTSEKGTTAGENTSGSAKRRGAESEAAGNSSNATGVDGDGCQVDHAAEARKWKRMYYELLENHKQRGLELVRVKGKIMDVLQNP